MSRISQGKLQLRKERITIAAAIRHALEICGQMVEDQGHELTVKLPEETVYLDADQTRLAQAVGNLLTNAAKYSDPGGRIWLTVQQDDGEVSINVKDTGVGIPADMLGHVFQMFTQVDRTLEKSQGGLGVGLAIVKRLVELHGGSVEARSEGWGKGSEFIIRLPIARPLRQRLSDREHTSHNSAAGHRILVVDDNVDAAGSLTLMLQIMGNEVRAAHDGEAGFDAALAFRPNVILMDIGMPRLNGYDAARRIREQPWGKAVALVALTGWGQEEDSRKSEEAGFDYHLVKPVEPATLEKLLSGLAQ